MLILIPCKNLDQGKSRLATELDPRSRRSLCELFLCQTLALATSMIPPGQVKIVTDDPRAVGIGADYGASSVQDLGIDLNSALAGARNLLLSDRSFEPDVLVLPTDLPYATPNAIATVMADTADIAIVPDHEEEGTNILFLRFGAFRQFPFAFGVHSFARHCAIARSAGHTIQIVRDDRLAFDVDQPRHYLQWRDATG
jgi:2-phospho-L-lactate/phosphoenolpyruvate guanylyltransferase